jgi:type IV pilus assembly protein PilB
LGDPGDYTFEDTLYARVGRGKKLRLLQACGAHVVAAATGVSNTPVVEAGAVEVDYSVLGVKFGMNSEEMRKVNPKDRGMTADLFLRWCLYQAWIQEAADIHFETAFGKGRARLRVDSDLREIARIPMALMAGVVQLACDWAGPGTSGSQYAPGDGRFGFRLDQTVYDVRVAKCMVGVDVKFPKVTMRLLGKKVRSLDSMGFAPRVLEMLKRMIRMPQGLILLTGPTGSGKTSSVSSCIKEINTPDINIETTENPIEITIEGVNQAEVNEARGATFGALLKSILRRDPDVISVGELRDLETAETAVQAALTGHLVFATLHTNSACAVVERLISLGVEPYLLGEVLLGIGGQRLKDRLCMRCRQEIPVLEEHRRVFAAANVPVGDVLYESRGCPHCRGSGKSGRVLISELFPVTGREGGLIAGKCRGSELEEHYKGLGYMTMYQDMLRHVAEGRMSLQESYGFSRDWILG